MENESVALVPVREVKERAFLKGFMALLGILYGVAATFVVVVIAYISIPIQDKHFVVFALILASLLIPVVPVSVLLSTSFLFFDAYVIRKSKKKVIRAMGIISLIFNAIPLLFVFLAIVYSIYVSISMKL